MLKIVVPNRITWLVDLSRSEGELFSEETYKRITSDKYEGKIYSELCGSDSILQVFLPQYKRLIMNRQDFRLDPVETEQKMVEIANNQTYKLMICRGVNDDQFLGGIVLHFLKDKISVAYRCFDHDHAKSYKLNELDYYAELLLHKVCKDHGISLLSHGNDKHPVTQIGLSIYKLRVGAQPYVAQVSNLVEFADRDINKVLGEGKIFGYYSNPGYKDGRYTEFHMVGTCKLDLENSFVKVAERAGISVIREEVI